MKLDSVMIRKVQVVVVYLRISELSMFFKIITNLFKF